MNDEVDRGTDTHLSGGRRRAPLLAALVGLLVGLGSCGGEPAAAPEVEASIDVGWATASLTAHRDGWGAVATVTVEDREDDGDCVSGTVRLVVTAGPEISRSTDEVCGTGTRTSEAFDLRPGYQGTGIASIELIVTRNANTLLPDPTESTSVALPQMTSRASEQEKTDTVAFMTASLASFQASRDDAPRPWDWNSDGCSVPDFFPDIIVGTYKDLFLDACQRHDFGYRNFGRKLIDPTDSRRDSIDGIFRDDMLGLCATVSGPEQPACRQAAEAFHLAVRNFGGRAFYGP